MNLEPKNSNATEVQNDVPRKTWIAPVVEEIEFRDTSFGANSTFVDGSFVSST